MFPVPASPLVEELMEWLAQASGLTTDQLLISHPLHSFSVRYNQNNNPKLKNYLLSRQTGFDFGTSALAEIPPLQEVDLKQLSDFFENPLEYFYNHVLGIYYGDPKDVLKEKERFEMGNLEEWFIKDQIIQSEECWNEDKRKELVVKGKLPLRLSGKIVLDEAENELIELKDVYKKHLPLTTETQKLRLDEIILSGKVTTNAKREMVFVTVSKDKTKYRIRAALNFLFGRALGYQALHYLTINTIKVWDFQISKEEAIKKLSELIGIFSKFRNKKFLFTPEVDFSRLFTELDESSRLKKAFDLMDKKMNPFGDPYIDPYLKKEYESSIQDAPEQLLELLKNTEEVINIIQPIKL